MIQNDYHHEIVQEITLYLQIIRIIFWNFCFDIFLNEQTSAHVYFNENHN